MQRAGNASGNYSMQARCKAATITITRHLSSSKAHALALLAVSRGKKSATWIAAATLDRYLMAIGQPQIYGTQFTKRDDGWSQEPYQRELLSDALREASSVPPIAQQERQRSALSARDTGE